MLHDLDVNQEKILKLLDMSSLHTSQVKPEVFLGKINMHKGNVKKKEIRIFHLVNIINF